MQIQIQQIVGRHHRGLHGADKEFVDDAIALLPHLWRIIGCRMGCNNYPNTRSPLPHPDQRAIVEFPKHPAFRVATMSYRRTGKDGEHFGTAQQSIVPTPRNHAQAHCHHVAEHGGISIAAV
jgi:hypothetical protein